MSLPFVGLVNNKNTCYSNVIIQVLYNNTELLNSLIKNKRTGDDIVDNFSVLLKGLKEWNLSLLEPRTFNNLVSQKFSSTEIHDAHEFLLFLLDKLHEATKVNDLTILPPASSQLYKKSHLEWNKIFKGKKSIVSKLFYGMYLLSIKCENCGTVSQNFEIFNYIYLDCPALGETNMIELFDRNFQDTNVLKDCDKCLEKNTRHIISKTIFTLPKHLIILIKRFNDTNLMKNNTSIEDFESIDLSNYTLTNSSESVCYNFKATVCHKGMTMNDGHYFAYIRENKLYCVNDVFVLRADIQDIPTDQIYLLFYTQRN